MSERRAPWLSGRERPALGQPSQRRRATMDTRTRVWVPRAGPGEQQWVAAEILAQSDAGVCTCMTMEGDEVEVAKDQLEMREVLPDDGVDDLTSLKFLHEPAILNNLLTRFNAANGEGKQRKLIYTYCGHICIAVNPFEWLRELYTVEVMQQFRCAGVAARAPLFSLSSHAARLTPWICRCAPGGVCTRRTSHISTLPLRRHSPP